MYILETVVDRVRPRLYLVDLELTCSINFSFHRLSNFNASSFAVADYVRASTRRVSF